MIPPTCPQNVYSISLDIAKPISSYMYQALYTTSTSILFRSDLPISGFSHLVNRSDLPLFDHKKTDWEPIDEFLWRDIYCYINIKDSLLKQASFYEYTLKVVACMIIIREGRLDPDIWPKTPN